MDTATSIQLQSAETPATQNANPKQPPSGFLDFRGLLDFVPLGERTTRELIKRRIIPCIRIKGGRRLLFHPESVQNSLLRYQKGGIE